MTTKESNSFFSKPIVRAGAILLFLVLLLLLILKYCKMDKPSIVMTDPVKAPVAIALIDANRLLNTQIEKAKITLIDPDSMVVTSNGLTFNTIEITGGVMCLALKTKAVFNDTMPYRFTIRVESEGYSSNQYNVLVTSDKGQYVPIFMAKLSDPPEGMASFVGAAPLNGGVIGNAGAVLTTLSSPVSNGITANKISVVIPGGTEPIYCNRSNPNAKTPKNLNFRISYASPRSLAVGRTFPGGALVTDAVDLTGNTVARPNSPIYFASAGWMNLEMDADGDEVTGFTKPVTVTMPILDSLINPLTKPLRFYKAGDTIPVWSLNNRGVWRQESVAKVEGTPGNLQTKMTITHLSTWNLDCTQNPCVSPGQDLTVAYTYNPGPGDANTLSLYSEIVRNDNGIPFGITGLGTNTNHILQYNSGGGNFTIARTPNGTQLNFIAYNNSAAPGNPPTTGALASTGMIPINCTAQPSPTLSIPAGNTIQTVNLAFSYRSAGTDHPICENAVFFSACNTCADAASCNTPVNPYQFGGILTSSGTEGLVTLRRTGTPFNQPGQSNICIKLWYGKDISGEVSPEAINFNIDFADTSTRTITINRPPAVGNILIDYSFSGGVHRFRITQGLLVLPSCTIL
jgi:hypothetical protein